MRAVSAEWPRTIAQNHPVVTEVTSWRDGVQLGTALRPQSGELVFDSTARIDRRATLVFSGSVGTPSDPNHPLAYYGQRLHIMTGVVHPQTGATELLDMGWYLITDWDASGGVVTVQAESLRRLLDDAKLWAQVTATGVGAGLFYGQQVTGLSAYTLAVGQALPVVIDAALSGSLAVQADRVYSVERTAELEQLAAEWGATMRTTDGGSLRFGAVPPALTASTPIAARVVDGAGGTLIDRAAAGSRSRIANVLWVTGRTPAAGPAPRGAALWSPAVGDGLLWSGPYGQVVVHETNDAVTTVAECRTWAATRLAQLVRPGVEVPLITLPDASWQLDDVIEVATDGVLIRGRVGSMRLPLTAAEGPMSVTLLAGDYGTTIPQ